MKCSVCGSENLEGSAYCEDCGARLPVGAAAVATQEAPAAPSMPVAPPPPPPVPAPEPVAAVPAPPPAAEEPSVSGTVTCSACGAENPSYEAYCEDCGASLTAARAGAGLAAPVPVPVAAPPAPPSPVAARPRLALVDSGTEFPVDKDEIALGRRSPADGIFPDVDLTDVDVESYISRRHGRIVRQDGRFLYEDIGSSNGSFLNGTRLQSGVQAELHEGDRLRLGKTEMVFRA